MKSKIIQISCLGNHGRWGNQLFQFCVAAAVAEKTGMTLEIPYGWIGEKIFDIQYPFEYITKKPFPPLPLDFIPPSDAINYNLFGYFQNQSSLNLYSRTKIKQWLPFKSWILERYPASRFYDYDDTSHPRIAAHYRCGDYQNDLHLFCIPTKISYIRAAQSFGYNPEDMSWITEENPCIDYGIDQDIKFLPDFMKMVVSDVLFRGPSTFSWWASVLGNAKTYAPIVKNGPGIRDCEFVEGNWPQMFSGPSPTHTDLYLKD